MESAIQRKDRPLRRTESRVARVRRASGTRQLDREVAHHPPTSHERDEVGEILARDAVEEHVHALRNKLAAAIANAEVLSRMVDGEAAGRALGLLRSARAANEIVTSLQDCLR